MEEPMAMGCRRTRVATRAASLLIVGLALASCNGSAPTPTRLVGAHRMALVVPAEWKTEVEEGSFCAPTDPGTVQFFTPLRRGEGVGSCAVPIGASWPAQD